MQAESPFRRNEVSLPVVGLSGAVYNAAGCRIKTLFCSDVQKTPDLHNPPQIIPYIGVPG